MFGTMGQTNVKNLGNGGTMDGDVTITGDLTVSGGISLSLNEVLQGTSTIDINSTEALLVRKDSDGGDVFIVDTTNMDVTVNGVKNTTTFSVTNNWSTTNDFIQIALNDATIRSTVLDSGARNLILAPLGNDALTLHSTSGGVVSVGIGTTSPATELHLKGRGEILRIENDTDASGNTFMSFYDTSALKGYLGFIGGSTDHYVIYNNENADIRFFTNATHYMTLNASGQLGLGTASPSSLMHITSSTADGHLIVESTHATSSGIVDIRSSADRDSVIHFREGTTVKARIKNDSSEDALVLSDGSDSDTVFIKSNKVGIGDDAPDRLLNLKGDNIYLWAKDAGGGNSFFIGTDGGNDSLIRLYDGSHNAKVEIRSDDVSYFNAGSVGIGTATPTLSYGTGLNLQDTNVGIRLSVAGSGGWGFIEYADEAGTVQFIQGYRDTDETFRINASNSLSNTDGIAISNSGLVGIGTASPSYTLTAEKSVTGDWLSRIYNTATSGNPSGLLVRVDDPDSTGILFGANANGTYRFVVKPDGNVGIGTSSPSDFDSEANNLVVGNGSGDNGITIFTGSSAGHHGSIFFGDATGTPKQGQIRYEQNNEVMSFHTNATERMRIDLNGNVGIGTSSPTASRKMTIQEATSQSSAIHFTDTDTMSQGIVGNARAVDDIVSGTANNDFVVGSTYNKPTHIITNNTIKTTIDSSGNVGIGVSSGISAKLDVNGSAIVGRTRDIGSYASDDFDLMVTNGDNDATVIALYNDAGAFHTGLIEYYQNKLSIGLNNSNSDDSLLTSTAIVLDANSRISLSNNDSGTSNTFFGKLAGNSIQSGGNDNCCFGHEAGKALTTGDTNTLLGTKAGTAMATGQNNVMIGNLTGDATDGSSLNVFIGSGAVGASDATQNGTVAVGYYSLHALTSAQRMTAIGYQALMSEDAGSYQTAVGYQALSQVNNDNGHNVALGQRAGYNLTTGYSNTLIGSGADASGSGGVNQTVIGQGTTGVADNSVTLGNSSVTKLYVGAGGTDQSIVFKDSAEQGKIRYDHNNEQFQIFVGGSEKVKFETGGDIRLLDGGINFPDSQNASSDANTLDDYEEGIFTPTLTTNSTDFTSVTYDAETSGRYTKVGNIVHVQGFIRTDAVSIGSASGDVCIGGLPFTAITSSAPTARNHATIGLSNASGWNGENPSHGLIIGGGTLIQLYYADYNVDPNNVAVSDVTGGTVANQNQVYFAGTYIV